MIKKSSLLAALLLLGSCAQKDDRTSLPAPVYDSSFSNAATSSFQQHVIEEQADSLTLDALNRIAMESNSELIIAQENINAAEGRRLEAGLYPNPSIGLDHKNMSANNHSAVSEESEAVIRQPIVIGKRLSTAQAVARAEIQQAEIRYEETRRSVLKRVHDLYAEILFHQQHENIIWDLAGQIEPLSLEAKSETDRARIDIVLDQLYLEITTIAVQQSFRGDDLELLLGDSITIHSSMITGSLGTELRNDLMQQLVEHLADQQPSIARRLSELTAEEKRLDLAKAEIIPDVTPSVGFGYRYDQDEGYFRAGLEIPIPIFDRNQGRRQEALARIDAAQEAFENELRLERSDVSKLAQYLNEIDTFYLSYRDNITPRARTAFQDVSEKYLDGGASIHDLLSAAETLIESERQLVTYQYRLMLGHTQALALLGFPESF